MRNSPLFIALTDIEDRFVVDAAPRQRQKLPLIKYAAIAACFTLIFGTVWAILPSGQSPQNTTEDLRWPTTIIEPSQTSDEIYKVPLWNEKTLSEQFPSLKLSDIAYRTHSKTPCIPLERLADALGEHVLSGFDIYEDKTHQTTVTVYTIRGIDKNAAVAVRFPEQEGYYPYVNSSYTAKTLAELIRALDLENTVSFGSIWYTFEENGKHRLVEFSNIADEKIWEYLLSDIDIPITAENAAFHKHIMSISVHIPLLGYKNISLAVTEDGYMTTNILETGKLCFIGTEKVTAFVQYVLENGSGLEHILVEPTTSHTEKTNENTNTTVVSTARRNP